MYVAMTFLKAKHPSETLFLNLCISALSSVIDLDAYVTGFQCSLSACSCTAASPSFEAFVDSTGVAESASFSFRHSPLWLTDQFKLLSLREVHAGVLSLLRGLA